MRILVKELFKASPTDTHDYDVQDVVYNDVKSILQNQNGGLTIITESERYINIPAQNYHYIQIF